METKFISGITILGLGPGDAGLLTRQAWDWLQRIDEIFLRTCLHPTVAGFPGHLKVNSFDGLYDQFEQFEQVYENIVMRILELGSRPQGVTYAVPGHPFVAEATTPEIIRRGRAAGIPVKVIDGLSFIDPVFSVLEVDPFSRMIMMDALELGARQLPPFSPDCSALIAQIYSPMIASEVKLTLTALYPDEHPVRLVHEAGTQQCQVEELKLYEIDRSQKIGLRTVLYLPPMPEEASFEAFQEVVARLRAPGGCPWDRKQTHQSLRRFLLEEAYEVIEAIDDGETSKLAEELGDLLLQILLHAQIGFEMGEFTMLDVLTSIHQKIIRRHPHVFDAVHAETPEDVIETWERIKALERSDADQLKNGTGILEGVPQILPALVQAQAIQERAARVGFDWDDIAPVFQKIKEEFDEVCSATQTDRQFEEVGDLLFAIVNLARWLKVDSEDALRSTNNRFRRRFSYIEEQAVIMGKELKSMTLAEMDELWEQAKDLEGSGT